MTRITVSLERAERAALQQLAAQERRDPRAQAAYLIREALEQLGLLQPTPVVFDINQQEGANGNG